MWPDDTMALLSAQVVIGLVALLSSGLKWII